MSAPRRPPSSSVRRPLGGGEPGTFAPRMVAVRLGAGNARLRWSKTPLPALENLSELPS
jgi:hypothetical protein